jgi:hypothetical protein
MEGEKTAGCMGNIMKGGFKGWSMPSQRNIDESIIAEKYLFGEGAHLIM